MAFCPLCQRTQMHGNSVPKSVHKTGRALKPNLQKVNGLLICTRCARTMKKVLAS
ncbi:MAG: bL28 family ribosomal protein [Patescibacteria group bacterium]|jgi:ribosomal protein L28